jgi:hypothetical protein
MTAPFQYDPTGQTALDFTSGEKVLSPVLIGTTPGRAQHYLARWLHFTPGPHVLRLSCKDAATVWLGDSGKSLSMIAAVTSDDGVVEINFNVQTAGVLRLQFMLHNIGLNVDQTYVIFSIKSNGRTVYLSTADKWSASTSVIADEDVEPIGDARRFLPVFSFQPNWKNGILERLVYLTDVISSDHDSEQRRMLRLHPRRTFEMSFMREGLDRATLDNFVLAHGSRHFLAPLWHEQFRVNVPMPAGSTSFTVPAGTASEREFLPGSLVLVIAKDVRAYEVATVLSVVGDVITFEQGLTLSWGSDVRMVPLRESRLDDIGQMRNHTDRVGELTLRIAIRDTESYTPTPSWSHFVPLFRFDVDRNGTVDIDHERKVFRIDNQVGKDNVFDPGHVDRVKTKVRAQLHGRSKVWQMRKFIAAARAKAIRFWAPSFTHDIVLAQDIGGDVIEVLPSGFFDATMNRQDSRVLIRVDFADGRPPLYRKVISVERVGLIGPPWRCDTERLTLDESLPPLPRDWVERVSFMIPTRFDQDTFEFKHHVDDSAVVETSLVFKSAEIDNMPPIELVATSYTYPIVSSEGVSVGVSLLSGSLRFPIYNYDVEGLNVGATLLTSTLAEKLKTTTYDVEGLNVGVTLLTSTLAEKLKTTTYDVEGLNVGATLTTSQLRNLLIQTSYDTEGLTVGVQLTSGTLQ